MADNAPKVAAKERREPLAAVNKKAEILANQIKKSKHFIVFTGAGISTSAGMPDFRGPDGNWTLRAQGRARTRTANTLQAVPTPAHMALVELQNRGILKFLVSQNCDGLHRRSGILPDRISELHGNSNRECCYDCDKEYLRDFRTVSPYGKDVYDHRTGQKCTRCGGALHDSIVNFGENLPPRDLTLARDNAETADLCLVLGSSLTVTPANGIPEIVGQKNRAKLAICNLQATPIDELAEFRIFCEADVLMMKEDRHRLIATEVDSDGTPVTFLQSVRLEGSRRVAREEPFIIHVRELLQPGSQLNLELEFMGHYNEPNLVLAHNYNGEEEILYILSFNPQNGQWVIEIGESLT